MVEHIDIFPVQLHTNLGFRLKNDVLYAFDALATTLVSQQLPPEFHKSQCYRQSVSQLGKLHDRAINHHNVKLFFGNLPDASENNHVYIISVLFPANLLSKYRLISPLLLSSFQHIGGCRSLVLLFFFSKMDISGSLDFLIHFIDTQIHLSTSKDLLTVRSCRFLFEQV